MPRSLATVIDQILSLVPDEQTAFRAELERLKESLGFTAPEAEAVRWNQCATILNRFTIDAPSETIDAAWFRTVCRVFKGSV